MKAYCYFLHSFVRLFVRFYDYFSKFISFFFLGRNVRSKRAQRDGRYMKMGHKNTYTHTFIYTWHYVWTLCEMESERESQRQIEINSDWDELSSKSHFDKIAHKFVWHKRLIADRIDEYEWNSSDAHKQKPKSSDSDWATERSAV